MARRQKSAALAFDALSVEGSLIAPAMMARIALREAGGQTEADYHAPKGLTLRDEIARYFRIGQAYFAALAASPTPSTAATVKFTEELLREVFGFADLRPVGTRTVDGHHYAVTLEGLGGRVPVVVVPPADALDRATGHLPGDGRRRSAASALQDWLNANDDALWGLACNGDKLRLVRDNASLTRPAYIEADLKLMFEAEGFADFAALWLLVHASRFGTPGTLPGDCALERWRDAGTKEGIVARDRLRGGFEAALLALANGFLQDVSLRARLQSGDLPLTDYFSQLLRLVYRLIFLLAAEDRNLLHPPAVPAGTRRLYAEGYSLASLRERAVRRANWDGHEDRWRGLLVTFTALRRGEARLGLPALGGLFAALQLDDLEAATLPNRALMEAIYRLAWLKDEKTLAPVNWRDMETEELGSVYEGLLELTPRIGGDGRSFAFAEGAETKGNARKTSGSYYTPDSLVQALLNSSLDPVLDRLEAEALDPAEALLGFTVIDPACGSGHFLLAAARRIASRVARYRAGGVASADDYRHALRDVARRCIHGVDRNPMAVELTKVALWIETVEPGKPLGFLDANIRCGDSLLGVFDLSILKQGIPDDAYKPLTGDDKETARHFLARNRAEKTGQGSLDYGAGGGKLPPLPPLGVSAETLRSLPEETAEQVAERERHFAAGMKDLQRWHWQLAADLYVAAFLVPKTGGVPLSRDAAMIPTSGHVWQAASGSQVFEPLVGLIEDLSQTTGAFHWPLEFPDVMAAGGFDLVVGNPPWEVLQLGEEEYFAQRWPEIAELAGATRKRAISALEHQQPEIFRRFESDKRKFEAGNEFARSSGRFDLTARGKVNSYSLFAELFAGLVSERGRAGVIVPTGIATDATTAAFFAALVDQHKLVSLTDFENSSGIFSEVHRSSKFCLLTIGSSDVANFSFFLTEVSHLADVERQFTLAPAEIGMINPNTKTSPVFRSRTDAELVARIYGRVPVFVNEGPGSGSNPWNIQFRQGLFNMTSDSGLFRTSRVLISEGYVREGQAWRRELADPTYVPLYEAKMFDLFDHRAGSYPRDSELRGNRVLPETTLVEHEDPTFEPEPFYWVSETEVSERMGTHRDRSYFLGFHDISTPVTSRSFVPTISPISGMGNNQPLIFPGHEITHTQIAALVGMLSSIGFDYVARQKMGRLHFNYFIVKQLPVLRPDSFSTPDLGFIVPRVLELTYTSRSLFPFAQGLGYAGAPFAWNEDRRAILRAELDVFYARKYGLTRDELRYILDPAAVMGPDYPSETFRVLKNNDIKRYGEYRTGRLVLQAWDRMEALGSASE